MNALLAENDALARILAGVTPLPAERVSLLDALGRFAAAAQTAQHALPGFDNSAMDGYAVAAPLAAGARLRVTGVQPAGRDLGLRVEPGAAVRIFTGAPLPAGTAAVVMQEDVERGDGDQIVVNEPVAAGEFIRRAGSDLARGQALFGVGARLGPAQLGLLASQGVAEVSIGRRARVAVLTTGDELRGPGELLGPGEIYESNGTALAALTASLGATAIRLPRAPDDRAMLDPCVANALVAHDVLIIAGGVSVGERDFVKDALLAAGVEIDLWRVRIKPGKPFLYGRAPGGAPVFGLPGNPVSAFVTFLLFVRPALLRMMGAAATDLSMPQALATAGAELVNDGDRPHYQHGRLDANGCFQPLGAQQSHALFGLSRSNALARVEAGQRVEKGESLPVLLLP